MYFHGNSDFSFAKEICSKRTFKYIPIQNRIKCNFFRLLVGLSNFLQEKTGKRVPKNDDIYPPLTLYVLAQ
jgi:hypothetical protein